MKILKQEKGSITVFVLIAMLFFSMYLIGMYIISANAEATQVAATKRVKEIYESDNNQIDDVYATLNKENRDIANAPKLTQGMTPVKWNGTTWIDTNQEDIEWYDYTNKKWANVRLQDGSMFVWIPRYAYQIASGWHSNIAGKIEITFLKDTTNIPLNGKKIEITTTSGENNWLVSPGFYWDNNNNGKEDSEEALTGIWVAKYEASNNQGKIEVKQGVASWRGEKIDNYFTYAKDMNSAENASIYGLSSDKNKIEPHMLKNTEWGIVAYLATSQYGKNAKIGINNNTSYLTGMGGVDASTTGNQTGIYDMCGGNWEFVAAYTTTGTANLITNGTILSNAERKYKDMYTGYNLTMYGDAIYETTSENIPNSNNAWYTEYSDFMRNDYPFMIRGGYIGENASVIGIFAFYANSGYNQNPSGMTFNNIYGFRPSIVILK